jgi:hypothetical protein
MGARGRKSTASLAITTVAQLETVPRPDAPYDLTDEETNEWWAVINRMPADWFPRETHPLLSQYCRHVVRARRIAQLIQVMEGGKDADGQIIEFDLKSYNRMLIMQERETRAIAALSTKMRLAQQSTIDKETKKKGVGRKPWDRQ